MSSVGLTGLKSRCRQGCTGSGDSRRQVVSVLPALWAWDPPASIFRVSNFGPSLY